jgi:hypothetical protein
MATNRRSRAARAALAMLDGALTCEHDDLMTCESFQGRLRGVPGCADLPPPRS